MMKSLMLAASIKESDYHKLIFPMYLSAKLDGVRSTIEQAKVLSRSFKPIPNKHIQKVFGKKALNGLDGEFILGSPTDPKVFPRTMSACASHDGEPDVTFYVFDFIRDGVPFKTRIQLAEDRCDGVWIESIPSCIANNLEELLMFENEMVERGFEGIMGRSLEAFYKYGRSTLKEQGLIKFKRFEDSEARIIGFDEQMHNANESVTDARGRKERSTKKAGLTGKGTLGSLKVVGLEGKFNGISFGIGTGFDDELKQKIWDNQGEWVGRIVKFKYFPIGSKDAPRFPVYLGLRADFDK